ncbi:MAG TPA: hypothetical protein VL967_05525 [Terracidiphilus sp.]|nr:hypothetical protein [Terracidiphilus sp.]
MKKVEIVCAGILVLGAIGHSIGSYYFYKTVPLTLLWALGSSLALLLLACINFLRIYRPGDRALAWICFFGNVAWVAACVAFARLIGNPFDVRPDLQGVAALLLAVFSIRSGFASRPVQA